MKTIKCVSLDEDVVEQIEKSRGLASFSAALNDRLKRNSVIVVREYDHPRL